LIYNIFQGLFDSLWRNVEAFSLSGGVGKHPSWLQPWPTPARAAVDAARVPPSTHRGQCDFNGG